MNSFSKLAGSFAIFTTVFVAGNAFAANPAAVFQRTANTESIELSNIEEDGAAQVPVVVGASVPQSGVKETAISRVPAKSPLKPAPTRVAKKNKSADGTEETDVAEGDEEDTSALQADGGRTAGRERGQDTATNRSSNSTPEMNAIGMGSGSWQGGTSGGTGFAGSTGDTGNGTGTTSGAGNSVANTSPSSGGSGSGATASTGTGAGTAATAGASGAASGTGTGTGNTASSGGGATGSGTSGTPAASVALGNKLELYRNQMMQEVVNAQVTNPALTRRYQMVDKATYKSLGL